MSEIKTILVQVRPQGVGDPGQVVEGFYIIEDGYLQMTYRDGQPLESPLYRVALADGVNPNGVAANLTKAIRRELSGEIVPGFNRDISYSRAFVA